MKYTVNELANAMEAKVEGDSGLEVTGVAAPERATLRDLIYVESAKHVERALASSAICVVAPDGISLPGKTVLRSAKPKVSFAKAAALLRGRSPIAWGSIRLR
jgi:UDP-3-O-[3-hydroxymyristoyl] glucosamine N-acyltransferase